MRAILEPGGVSPRDRSNRATPAPIPTANYQRHSCVTRRFRQALEPQRLYLPFSAPPEVLGSTIFCPPVPAPPKTAPVPPLRAVFATRTVRSVPPCASLGHPLGVLDVSHPGQRRFSFPPRSERRPHRPEPQRPRWVAARRRRGGDRRTGDGVRSGRRCRRIDRLRRHGVRRFDAGTRRGHDRSGFRYRCHRSIWRSVDRRGSDQRCRCRGGRSGAFARRGRAVTRWAGASARQSSRSKRATSASRSTKARAP